MVPLALVPALATLPLPPSGNAAPAASLPLPSSSSSLAGHITLSHAALQEMIAAGVRQALAANNAEAAVAEAPPAQDNAEGPRP